MLNTKQNENSEKVCSNAGCKETEAKKRCNDALDKVGRADIASVRR